MRKLIVVILLTLSLTAYSQDTAKQRSKEITKYLAEGLEAKQILIVRNRQLRSKDSTIALYVRLDSLQAVSDSLKGGLIRSLEVDNKKLQKSNDRKSTWIKILFSIAFAEALYLIKN